jgi:hypothetical protein
MIVFFLDSGGEDLNSHEKYIETAESWLISSLYCINVKIPLIDTVCAVSVCITGHAGCFKTPDLISYNYQWPQICRYIGIYIKTCYLYNWPKLKHHWPYGELHPTETPEDQWDIMSIDFIVELPQVHGYDTIMVVIDSVTKWAHFIPVRATLLT